MDSLNTLQPMTPVLAQPAGFNPAPVADALAAPTADPLAPQAQPQPVQAPFQAAQPVAFVQPAAEHMEMFKAPGMSAERAIMLPNIPVAAQNKLLRSAVRAYITNRLSSAANKITKANKDWEGYDNACNADPLQTVVPKPEKAREVLQADAIVDNAIKALYDGNIATRQKADPDRPKKEKVAKDPVIAQITRTVVAELFAKRHAADNHYKYPTAQKEVGQDGLAYLKDRAREQIAAGANEQLLIEHINSRYVKPARIMLGLEQPEGATQNVSLV